MDRKQRISYLPLEAMDDEMRAEMERCRREGTPRPESSAVRAHVPACFWAFARSWQAIFRDGERALTVFAPLVWFLMAAALLVELLIAWS